ncbi:MAG: NUDIX domain-containing protein [Candidatus Berkelbacteria bacterium]|nr:NUDIX domain-containing protein [Candidatus Berkelbacteria bacterium]
MSEIVTTYKINDPDEALPMERDKFYSGQIAKFKKTGKPTKAVGIVDIILFNGEGEVYIQKRSNTKAHNPGLLDKSIGGHLQYGDTAEYTVMVETVQELQVPSINLLTEKDFVKTLILLKEYLITVAVTKHIDTKLFILPKDISDEKINIANMVHLFFGIYKGAIKTVDRESKGTLLYSLDELEQEIAETPEIFTEDLRFFVKEYKPQIKKFIKNIQDIINA